MSTVKDGLIACVTRWLPVLEEAELRAVEGFVLELVIDARERAIALSTRAAAETPVVPHDAARVDVIPARDSVAGTTTPPREVSGDDQPHEPRKGSADVERALAELRDADAIDTTPRPHIDARFDAGGE